MARTMTNLTWLRLILAAAVWLPAASAQTYYDAIVAQVGDEVITRSDVVSETQQLEESLGRKYRGQEWAEKVEEARNRVCERMVEQELIYAEFKAKGYKVPAEAIQRRLDTIVTAQAGGNRERFAEMLYAQGLSFTEFEGKVSKLVAVDLLVDELVRRPIHVSPTDIRQYFDEHQEDFAQPARLKLAVILIRNDGRYKGQLEKTVQDLAEILGKDPADFANAARRFSEGPGVEAGGEMGWVREQDLSREFRTAVAGLQGGQVSKPVTIGDGMAILRLLERERKAIPEYEDTLAKRIEGRMKDVEEEKRYKEYVKTLTAKHFVQTFLGNENL